MSHYNQNNGESYVWGADPAVIEQAIRRGRLERSKAFHATWRAVFAYVTGRRSENAPATNVNGRVTGASAC